jgi:hypothetical protein
MLNVTSNTWFTVTLSQQRGSLGATSSNNKIFFGGGLNSSNGYSNVVDIFEIPLPSPFPASPLSPPSNTPMSTPSQVPIPTIPSSPPTVPVVPTISVSPTPQQIPMISMTTLDHTRKICPKISQLIGLSHVCFE